MNLNKQTPSVVTPDFSSLYIISGRIMFDDDDQVYLVEAVSLAEAEEAFRHYIVDSSAELPNVIIVSSESFASAHSKRVLSS